MAERTSRPPDLGALVEATLALTRELDPEAVLQKICDVARDLVGARYAALGVGAPDQDEFEAFIHSGLDPDEVARIGPLPRGRGILGELLRNPTALRLGRLGDHPSSVGFPIAHPSMDRFLGVPIATKGRVLGNLYLTEKVDGTDFDDRDQTIVEALAAQAAVAIDNARLYAEQRRATSRMEALFSAVRAFADVRDPDKVLQSIVDAARELAGAHYAAIGIVGDDGATFDAFIHSGMDSATVERIGPLPRGLGLLGTVIIEERSLRLAHIGAHPGSHGFPDGHPPMESFLGVPVRFGDEVLGHLYLTDKRDGPGFTADDEALIEALAGQAAVAIDNARNYERERRLVERMRTLLEANLTLTRELDPEQVLQSLVDRARELADAQYAALGVLDDDGDGLAAFIHSGMDPALVERIGPLPRGLGVLRAVIVAQRPIRLRDLGQHPASHGFPPDHPPMTSFLGVPVEHQGRVLGNLYLTNKRGGEFSDDDELLVSSLAAQAAVAIENSRVYRREQELVCELQELNDAMGEFVDTVSHEIKTPVGTLVNLTELLAARGEDMTDGDRAAALAAIERQAKRLSGLIADLLDLARLESEQSRPRRERIQLDRVVLDAVEDIDPTERSRIDVSGVCPTTANADASQLRRAVVNLVSNALRHGGSAVALSTDRETGRPRLLVDDDGPGIGHADRERIFDRFSRGSRPGSTGLGLAIVKTIVERHDGTVSVTERPGGGARFVVVLGEEPGEESEPDASSPPDPDLEVV